MATITSARRKTEQTTEPMEVVTRFFDAVNRLDVDAGFELCSDDIVYVNAPLTFSRTRAGGLRWLKAFTLVPGSFELRTDHIAVDGDTVLTGRTDIFRAPGGLELTIWVYGEHVVRDGRIVSWIDRFDYADVATAVPRALVRRLRGERV